MELKTKLINKYFREGIPAILFNFDPWRLKEDVENLKRVPPFYLFMEEEYIETVLVRYADNWDKVIGEYFTWNSEGFPDPVDQAKHISESEKILVAKLMKGIPRDLRDTRFVNLYSHTKFHVKYLCRQIMPWALCHKFGEELLEEKREIVENN